MFRSSDNLLIREKILSMTPEERKILGINKSTLLYLKKNVSSKDKIKIYDKILDKVKDWKYARKNCWFFCGYFFMCKIEQNFSTRKTLHNPLIVVTNLLIKFNLDSNLQIDILIAMRIGS